jgi:hydrogenase expression/formation protein HypE
MKDKDIITLAHGSGGKLTYRLIKNLFLKKFDNAKLQPLTDSAIFTIDGITLAFTTDSHTVKPIFFPGGDIGKLSVSGTINDLAVMGAKPLYLSCGLILEEGFDYTLLDKIITSMARTTEMAGVEFVTGDTKVVEKGKGDEIFINTSGIGIIEEGRKPVPEDIKSGDKVIINGSLGDHGIAVLSAREEFGLDTNIKSDCAPLNGLIEEILNTSNKVRFMRDPTRGGVASALNELVMDKDFGIILKEDSIPVKKQVEGICEILGFDPLYIANEGKVILIVDEKDAQPVLKKMKTHKLGKNSEIIGEVVSEPSGKVCLEAKIGGSRIIDMMVGEQLPRIC